MINIKYIFSVLESVVPVNSVGQIHLTVMSFDTTAVKVFHGSCTDI